MLRALTACMLCLTTMAPIGLAEQTAQTPTRLIDSPYDFGLSDTYGPVDPDATMQDIYQTIRQELPDEVPVVMPRAVTGAALLYVSPQGDDAADGSEGAPFQTVARALAAVVDLPVDARADGVVVYLREGTYRLSETLLLTDAVSGTKEHPLYVVAYPQESVIITTSDALHAADFAPVTDAEKLALLPENAREAVLVADLTALGITEYNDILHGYDQTGVETKLYWNQSAMTLARYPNYEYITIGEVLDPGPITQIEGAAESGIPDDGRGIEFVLRDRKPLTWQQTDDLFLYGFMCFEWLPGTYKVRSFQEDTASVRTYDTAMFGARERSGNKYYFFNVFEEMDVPGEWYLDRAEGKLYLYPYADMDTASIYLSNNGLDMIRVEDAKHIYFDGLTVTANSESGFVFQNSENIVVQNCEISLMGKLGIDMNACTYSGVTSSLLYNTDGSAVRTGGNEARDSQLIPSRNFVQNSGFSARNLRIWRYMYAR